MKKDLQFLSEKLEELGTGLFINQSDAVLKINAAIINLIKVDDAGQLWFFVPKPTQHLGEFEKMFLGNIQFYKKGKNFFIQITGKAFIVDDPEEINGLVDLEDDIRHTALNEKVLIRVRIEDVNFYESRKREKTSRFSNIPSRLHHIIKNGRTYRPNRFATETVAY